MTSRKVCGILCYRETKDVKRINKRRLLFFYHITLCGAPKCDYDCINTPFIRFPDSEEKQKSGIALVPQLAEGADSKSVKYQFDSDRGHCRKNDSHTIRGVAFE